MKPKKTPQRNRQRDLFRAQLSNIIDPRHGIVKLAKTIEWDRLDELFVKVIALIMAVPL